MPHTITSMNGIKLREEWCRVYLDEIFGQQPGVCGVFLSRNIVSHLLRGLRIDLLYNSGYFHSVVSHGCHVV